MLQPFCAASQPRSRAKEALTHVVTVLRGDAALALHSVGVNRRCAHRTFLTAVARAARLLNALALTLTRALALVVVPGLSLTWALSLMAS